MVSVWDEPAVDFMENFDTPAYKIPSASLTDHKLLKHVRKTGKPMIISTGMSTMEQIQEGGEGYRRGKSRHHALHQHLSMRTGRIESQNDRNASQGISK